MPMGFMHVYWVFVSANYFSLTLSKIYWCDGSFSCPTLDFVMLA